MVPPQTDQVFKRSRQYASLQPQAARKHKAASSIDYPEQAQLQQKLAIIGNESSRLELAKAYYDAQRAVERKDQHERNKKKEEQDKAERKRMQTRRASRRLATRSTSSSRSVSNRIGEPRKRSTVKKAGKLADSSSHDADDGDDEYLDSTLAANTGLAAQKRRRGGAKRG